MITVFVANNLLIFFVVFLFVKLEMHLKLCDKECFSYFNDEIITNLIKWFYLYFNFP